MHRVLIGNECSTTFVHNQNMPILSTVVLSVVQLDYRPEHESGCESALLLLELVIMLKAATASCTVLSTTSGDPPKSLP